jgi:hypothetical protein
MKSHHGVFSAFSIVSQGKLQFVQKRIAADNISFFFGVYSTKEEKTIKTRTHCPSLPTAAM